MNWEGFMACASSVLSVPLRTREGRQAPTSPAGSSVRKGNALKDCDVPICSGNEAGDSICQEMPKLYIGCNYVSRSLTLKHQAHG